VSNSIGKNIILIIGVFALQILVLNDLNISQYLLPFIYPILLLGAKRNMNQFLFLVLGFCLGLFMDVFSNTGAANALACLVLVFCRPFFLGSIGPMDMGSEAIKPTIYNIGIKGYFGYATFLLLIHHLVFFFLDVFTFTNFFETILRVIVSLVFSLILIILCQFVFVNKEK